MLCYTVYMHNRGVVVPVIVGVIAVLFFLSFMGFFRADQRPFGLSLKQALKLPCGLRVYVPKKDSVVSFPLTIRGYANGCGWVPDVENRLGILDVVGDNGVYFGSYVLKAKGDTTRAPYYFDGVISPQIPYVAEKGTFVFTPNVPNGKKVTIPVTFR